MISDSIKRLEYLCDKIPPLLNNIQEHEFSHHPAPGKWSKKEILGHLIDSASNNHQRFVRVQFEEAPAITYDQENWNAHGYYNTIDSKQLILFWQTFNRQLAALAKRIPNDKLPRLCRVGKENVTLEFLIKDYVVHMEHHLKQITEYN